VLRRGAKRTALWPAAETPKNSLAYTVIRQTANFAMSNLRGNVQDRPSRNHEMGRRRIPPRTPAAATRYRAPKGHIMSRSSWGQARPLFIRRTRRLPILVAGLVVTAGLAGPLLAEAPAGATAAAPAHLVVIFMENHSSSAIIGNPSVPYLNSFYKQGVRFTNYREGSTIGPSLPDYLQIAAGSGCGKTKDSVVAGDASISAAGCTTTVWNQLEYHGTSWGVYMDAMPTACSSSVLYTNTGLDTPYALKHNPATPFPSIWSNQSLCKAHVLPYSSFKPTAMPAVSFVAPGICNDQHGTSTGTPFKSCLTGSTTLMQRGDSWLAAKVPAMLSNGATVLITYDEGSTLYAAEVGPGITRGSTNGAAFTHYSVLAAIEDAYGLPRLLGAKSAAPLPL
jgi:phosphatidylinositol-3-phosphatase